MRKKLLLLMLVAVAMVATAWSQSVADFAFPRKVSAEALTQLDRAMRSGDGNAVVDAMIRYSIAQSSISKQSTSFIPSGNPANVCVAPATPNAGPTLASVVMLMPIASKSGTPTSV